MSKHPKWANRWTFAKSCRKKYAPACNGDEEAESDIRALISAKRRTRVSQLGKWNVERKKKAMKKLAPIAAIVLALTCSGCMTNGVAKVMTAVAADTNSFKIKVNGWGVSFEFERNALGTSVVAGDGSTGSVTLTPVTTMRVAPTK